MKTTTVHGVSAIILALLPWVALAKPVNVNKANAEEISSALTGIGQSKAQAIVDYRKAHGEFKSVDDLSQVKGIGEKTVSKNRDDIRLKD